MRRLVLMAALGACAGAPAAPAGPVTLTLIGTNDLHGFAFAKDNAGGLALLGGYLKNLRATGRPLLLIDAGDAFQGTLESNLNEGEMVVKAYMALGYDAMTIGNHELDFGPVGPAVTARGPGEDPRGALKARIAQARFPMLSANIVDEATGQPIARPSVVVERGGLRIGIIGLATVETPQSTIAANFRGLRLKPLAETINAEAARLRADGATLVIVTMHAGAKCKDPQVEATCEGELVDAAPSLRGVDAIVAGHTHAPVATRLGGIPVIESYSYGRAFGRIDLTLQGGRVVDARVFPPEDVRAGARYQNAPVVADEDVAALLRPYAEAARARREERLGVRARERIRRSYDVESPLGNLFVDLLRAARPAADVALSNGGALRTDLAAGDLTYGEVFEAFPFDNLVATVKLTGAQLKKIIAVNVTSTKSILSLSGVRARAACAPELVVTVEREDGRPVGDDDALTVVTSDFLATGGNDGAFKIVPPSAVTIEEATLLREEIVRALRARDGELAGAFDPAHPRLAYPGKRPVTCAQRPR